MKCRVIKMRKAGVAIPQRDLPSQGESCGDLSILDMRESKYRRIIRLARLIGTAGASETVHVLYEPQLLWMNRDRFVLTGFERAGTGGNTADYAQSWLCTLGSD
jgi:hypothetical protein